MPYTLKDIETEVNKFGYDCDYKESSYLFISKNNIHIVSYSSLTMIEAIIITDIDCEIITTGTKIIFFKTADTHIYIRN